MSAWIVTKTHIDYLLTAAITLAPEGLEFGRCRLSPETASAIGQHLWRENYRSVNYRYERRGRCPAYTFKPYAGDVPFTPATVWKEVGCYGYQTCERPDYPKSIAYTFVKALESLLGPEPEDDPEWAAAPWGIDD